MKWMLEVEKKTGVLHRITRPPPRREDEVATDKGCTNCPMAIVDIKTERFAQIWSSSALKHSEHEEMLRSQRDEAMLEAPNQWTVEDLDAVLKGEPDEGKGVDMLCCSAPRLSCMVASAEMTVRLIFFEAEISRAFATSPCVELSASSSSVWGSAFDACSAARTTCVMPSRASSAACAS